MENVIYTELKRRNKEVYYWKDRYSHEVDFAVKQGNKITELIQACWSLENEETKKRETRSLLTAMKELKTANATIISREPHYAQEGEQIQYKQLSEWLLTP